MSHHAFDQHELSRFLSQRRSKVGQTATMTGMGTLKGKWAVTDADYPRFYELMHDYLFVKRGRPMGFVEQPKKGEPKPLLIDLDFKYSSDSSLVRAFTLEQIRSFCHMLVDGLKLFFGVTDYESLRFFVTLRPAPYTSAGLKKDGVHILCPDLSLADEKQKVLRNWMLSQDAIRVCFADTGFIDNEAEGPEQIYDESMVRKQGWIFYGESKPNIPPYALEAVCKYMPETDTWEDEPREAYTPLQLMELLSVRYNLVDDVNEVREEARGFYDSMKGWGEARGAGGPAAKTQEGGAAGADVGDPGQALVAAEHTGPTANTILEALQALYPTEHTAEDRGMIRRFVMECLGQRWYTEYDKWIRVGWCLHNIDPSEEHFQLWMDFSAQSGKAGGNNVAQLRRDWFHGWRKEGDGPRLTERSLRKWAKDENPEVYKTIIAEYLGEFIRQEVEPTHHHIAKLMRKMYGSNYIASVNQRSTEWFKYDDMVNRWTRLNQGIELRMKISSEVAKAIVDAKGKLYSQMDRVSNEVREVLQEKVKALTKTEMSLYNSGFGESVMKMAVHQFYEEEFQNKLNIDGNLFGCRNGVLELRVPGADGRDHVVFRQGRPEDYVSFLAGQNLPETTAIDYKPYDPADPAQAEIMEFFNKLFPDPDVRRYTLRLLASCLEGFNREQCFYIATGVGGNGKSKLVELMRLTFGDYQTSLQSTVMTRKRPESGAANPDIMAAKCRRFIYLQEPDDKEPINTSRMKQFSGEDMVEARALYGDQEKFVIMGKLFMMCNRLPPVTTMDRGTWRRIRVLEFVSKFVLPDHPEYIARRPNVFLIDTQLDKKLREWREPFLALLVHIYETEYIPNGLNPVPAAVTRASDRYKENFDLYARFRAERIREPRTMEEKMECMNEPITTNKIKSMLSAWKKDVRVELSWQDVINRLTEEFGEPMNGKEWPTIRVFSSDDEVLNWDQAGAANMS
jgi:phage/plasmid-associated DNA primase